MKGRDRAWSIEARFQFIEFRLYWEGRINRSDLINHFGISVPQASIDLRRYLELAPGNAEYDTKRKAYFAKDGFKPVLTTPRAHDYLAQLELLRAEDGNRLSHQSFAGSPPNFDIVPLPERAVRPEIFRAVIRAIREGKALNILYQSMSRPEPTCRWIGPHAVASDGFRWHVRAYCYEKKRFSDFVFGRVLELGELRESDVNPAEDTEWHTLVELTIGPNESLPEGNRRSIEMDYGMENGISTIVVRKALSNYLKKRLGLIANIADSQNENLGGTTQHIRLVSEIELPPRMVPDQYAQASLVTPPGV